MTDLKGVDATEQDNLAIKANKPKLSFLPETAEFGTTFTHCQQYVTNSGIYVPFKCLSSTVEDAARIMEAGAIKYSLEGWKDQPIEIFKEALLRHAYYDTNEVVDKDSGYSHRAHMLCNVFIINYKRKCKSAKT